MAPHSRALDAACIQRRGGKGDWNSFKPTAPVGEIARLESVRGGHKWLNVHSCMQRCSTATCVHNGSRSSSKSRKKSGSPCECACARSLGAQHGQAEPNELQKSVCCEVRESNIPLELCLYCSERRGMTRGSKRGLQERKQIKSRLHCTQFYLPPALLQPFWTPSHIKSL